MKQIIAVHGLIGSGKTTTSNMLLKEVRGTIRPFAKPIKDFAFELGWNGIKDAKGRRLLQLLGTEVGRECIRDTLWVDKWQASLHNTGSKSTVICDDLRFQNEYEHLVALSKKMPVALIHITRPGKRKPFWKKRHKSEQGIEFHDGLEPYVIINDGTLKQLEFEIQRFVDGYL